MLHNKDYNLFKNLGEIPDQVLMSSNYGFEKIDKEDHIDNADFLFQILLLFENVKDKNLRYCYKILNLLQLPILEIDDRLDNVFMNDVDVLRSESIKIVNPALFYNSLLDKIATEDNIEKYIKSGQAFCKQVGILVSTPPKYVLNKDEYLSASSIEEELLKLNAVQVLRGSHLRVYFLPAAYILDNNPVDEDLENISRIIERSRGIELLIKDISDRNKDEISKSYNPFNLIQSKYDSKKSSLEIYNEIIDLGTMLLLDANRFREKISENKYQNAARYAYSIGEEALSTLKMELLGKQ